VPGQHPREALIEGAGNYLIASVARVSAIGHVSPAFRSIPAGLVHKSAHTIGGRQVVTPEAAWTRRPGAA